MGIEDEEVVNPPRWLRRTFRSLGCPNEVVASLPFPRLHFMGNGGAFLASAPSLVILKFNQVLCILRRGQTPSSSHDAYKSWAILYRSHPAIPSRVRSAPGYLKPIRLNDLCNYNYSELLGSRHISTLRSSPHRLLSADQCHSVVQSKLNHGWSML